MKAFGTRILLASEGVGSMLASGGSTNMRCERGTRWYALITHRTIVIAVCR